MNPLANEDKIFSSKSRKLKKQIAYKPYWDNTHPTATAVKQQEESDEESDEEKGGKKPNGYALLRKVYGSSNATFGSGKHSQLISQPIQKELNKRYIKVVDNYSDVVRHLEEHQKEGVGDPQDVKQSKYLRREIKRINDLHLTPANKVAGNDPLYQYSNPRAVQKKAFQLYGKDAVVYKSDKKEKKYQMLDENTGKFVYFGQMGYEDFTKHQDSKRRQNYLNRATHIKGDWKKNIYSPNFLAITLLW